MIMEIEAVKKPEIIETTAKKLDAFIKNLKDLSGVSLKSVITTAHDPDGKISKAIQKVHVDALDLMHDVETLKATIKAIKPLKHSRFANRIVAKYLEGL